MARSRRGKDEYNSFEDQLRRYRAVLDRLSALGLRVALSSRLYAYLGRLERVANDPNPYIDVALADQLTFDLREIDELIEIVEALPPIPAAQQLARLQLIHKGHEHPDLPTSDKARDAQYELYLWAVLTRGGLDVVFEEPDLIVSVGGHTIHVAAKRPTSLARFDDRLRDALDQLQQRPSPGVVALSLDRVVRPKHGLLGVPSMAELEQTVADVVALFTLENRSAIARRVAGKRVSALFFTTRLPGRAFDTNHSVLGTSLHVEVTAPDPSPERASVLLLAEAVRKYLT